MKNGEALKKMEIPPTPDGAGPNLEAGETKNQRLEILIDFLSGCQHN